MYGLRVTRQSVMHSGRNARTIVGDYDNFMRRIRDLLIYVLIGVVVAVGGYWIALQNVSDDSLVKWGGLGMNTLALFGWVIRQYRRFWRNAVFWLALGTLLTVHTAIFF